MFLRGVGQRPRTRMCGRSMLRFNISVFNRYVLCGVVGRGGIVIVFDAFFLTVVTHRSSILCVTMHTLATRPNVPLKCFEKASSTVGAQRHACHEWLRITGVRRFFFQAVHSRIRQSTEGERTTTHVFGEQFLSPSGSTLQIGYGSSNVPPRI